LQTVFDITGNANED